MNSSGINIRINHRLKEGGEYVGTHTVTDWKCRLSSVVLKSI